VVAADFNSDIWHEQLQGESDLGHWTGSAADRDSAQRRRFASDLGDVSDGLFDLGKFANGQSHTATFLRADKVEDSELGWANVEPLRDSL
jgi:hypothetical protein